MDGYTLYFEIFQQNHQCRNARMRLLLKEEFNFFFLILLSQPLLLLHYKDILWRGGVSLSYEVLFNEFQQSLFFISSALIAIHYISNLTHSAKCAFTAATVMHRTCVKSNSTCTTQSYSQDIKVGNVKHVHFEFVCEYYTNTFIS